MKPFLPDFKMGITLSIVIVNFNTKRLTLDLVNSIKEAKPSLSYEIIVVDNGSEEVPNGDFKLIENESNLGFAKGVNQGIRKATGSHILLLNSDTKVTHGAIDKLVEFAKQKPDAAAVVPQLINADGTIQPSCFRLPTLGGAIKQYWLGENDVYAKYVPHTPTVEAAAMAAFLITPRGLKEIGLLNEKYFMYFEDLDYCRKIKQSGLKIYYLDGVQITHIHGASGKNLAGESEQWKRLIPSSKIYHGVIRHYLISAVIWSGQKCSKIKKV
jgi:GT2 family glycosyltransferase